MFAYTKYDMKNDSIYRTDENYKYSDVILELTNKFEHEELHYDQQHRNIKLTDPRTNITYNYKFNLTTSDTGLADTLMYQKDFSNIENNKVYLFVCTIHTCKHNMIKKHPIKIYEANFKDIDWHFLYAHNHADIISKHKGLIEKIKEKDLILAAGEVYKTDDKLIYNLQTGSIKDSLLKNSENIKYHEEKEYAENPNCYMFYKRIFKPLIEKIDKTAVIDDYIRRTYGEVTTYEYMENLLKQYPQIKCIKTKI
jgi:hypothetical protein